MSAVLLSGCTAVRDTDSETAETVPVTYAGTLECGKYSLSYPEDMVFYMLDGSGDTLQDTVCYSDEDEDGDASISCLLSADELYVLTFTGAQKYDTPFRMAWQNAQCFLGDVKSCDFLGESGWYSEYNRNVTSGFPCRMVFIEKDGVTFAAEIMAESTKIMDHFMAQTNRLLLTVHPEQTEPTGSE